MFRVSLKVFKSAIKINAFVIIQLVAVLTTCIFMLSSLYSRVELYLPLKNILNSKASAVCFSSEYVNKENNERFLLDYKTSPLKEELKDVNEVYTRYTPMIVNESRNLSVVSYDDSVLRLFTPKLNEGKWLQGYNNSSLAETIPTVIFQNQETYNVGDIIEATATTYDNQDKIVGLYIIGIIDKETKIFGCSGKPLTNHLSFYETPAEKFNYEIDNKEEVIMAIVPNEVVTQFDIVARYDSVNSIVSYKNNIINSDIVLNTSELNMRYGSIAENIWTINDKSYTYVKTQLYVLLPIIICIVIIALISSICTSAITTKKNIKKYTVFYVCGISWRKNFSICIFNGLIVSIISFIITLTISRVISLIFNVDLIFNMLSVEICMAVLIFYIVMSLIIPYKILKSSSPKELLMRKQL